MAAPANLLPTLFLLSSILCLLAAAEKQGGVAEVPPRGWNSYDSFSWVIDEEAFLNNAEVVAQKLLAFRYEYVVVDFLWYRKHVKGASYDSYGYDCIDKWGRPCPDPQRWPSSIGGKGFRYVADKVHRMGLKFGIHVMRGISNQAVDAKKPILDIQTGNTYVEKGRTWSAKDIGLRYQTCGWMRKGFMSVDTDLGAGRAFLRSLYHQYADWGVDFVKVDCVFGDDFSPKEIITISELLDELNHPMILSISPGTSVTLSMAKELSRYVNMYRITADDWDIWSDVVSHFDISSEFAIEKKIGDVGHQGRSWPDLDMLPLGWLTDPNANEGPHRYSRLSLDEQKTQITLWSMAKSPLMYGGDLRNIDNTTLQLITHPTLLEINSYSSNNMEFSYASAEYRPGHGKGVLRQLKSQMLSEKPEKLFLHLMSCDDEKAKGWHLSSKDRTSDQICWHYSSTKHWNDTQLCLVKRKLLYSSDQNILHNVVYEDKFHLVPSGIASVCLDASVNGRRTASDSYSVAFSRCKWHAKQMWQLNDNGTLVSSYSSLCAAAASQEGNAHSGVVRSWIATGRKGEIYVAFFNLNAARAEVSLQVSDLRKVLPSSYFKKSSCNGTEVWSGRRHGALPDGRLADVVEAHGCSLFVLSC